ncbi:hypothetical protein GDO86_000670 [Hymenochirus boettgeri]|uniref:Uncharacterized protein n=1 Tax=Hymenochirus boettgeri TaxID=247094 RepID=A0A8T2KE19_9PIPI|nr:hypothetical protein GDO86_000670 [Hymenochirus boettgeri]
MLQLYQNFEKYECYTSNRVLQKSIFLLSLKVRKLFSIGKKKYQKHSPNKNNYKNIFSPTVKSTVSLM